MESRNDIEPLLFEASRSMEEGLFDSAESTLNQCLTISPNDYMANFLLAAINAQQKNYEQAQVCYENAVNANPKFDAARFQYGLLMATLENAEGATSILSPLTKREGDYFSDFAKAIIQTLDGNLEQAEYQLLKGIERNTENIALNSDMESMLQRIRNTDNSSFEPDLGESEDRSHLLDVYTTRG